MRKMSEGKRRVVLSESIKKVARFGIGSGREVKQSDRCGSNKKCFFKKKV